MLTILHKLLLCVSGVSIAMCIAVNSIKFGQKVLSGISDEYDSPLKRMHLVVLSAMCLRHKDILGPVAQATILQFFAFIKLGPCIHT